MIHYQSIAKTNRMKKIFTTILLVVCFLNSSLSQEDLNYSIENTEEGQYLVFGKRIRINIAENTCFDYIEEKVIVEGEKFIIIHVQDEMENDRGVLIFNKKAEQVNYDPVQLERKKHYKHYECCVYVQELDGKLYFWDIKVPDGKADDYDCYYDSQLDFTSYLIPRYYIFEPETGNVETIFLSNKCSRLIKDGKIICD